MLQFTAQLAACSFPSVNSIGELEHAILDRSGGYNGYVDLVILIAIFGSSILFGQGGHADFPAPLVGAPKDATDLHDPITELVRRIDQGKVKLEFDEERGYLPSILRELHIPLSSQMLVFSKTSLQHKYINPQTPRAIFFNDNTYAGFVPDGSLMELSGVDPKRGAVFYTLDQSKGSKPRLVRNEDCVQCHATPATLGVPGHLVRSVFTRTDGAVAMRAKSFLTDHRSPIEHRWGGWYITGTFERDLHMGNAFLRDADDPGSFDRKPGTAIKELGGRFHDDRYLSHHSDPVALMVLEHQAYLHNLLARLQYDAGQQGAEELANIAASPLAAQIEEVLRYMLFADEAPLKGKITGSSKFASEFEVRGPRDSHGRSLRQFDLKTRMFRYPCSYLIYSQAMAALPKHVKQRLYRRLAEILSAPGSGPGLLTPALRQDIAGILLDTHPDFAVVWRGLSLSANRVKVVPAANVQHPVRNSR